MQLDKRLIVSLFIFMVPFLAQAQDIEDRSFKEFESVRIFGKMTVKMIPGTEPSVHIEAKGVNLEKIKTTLENGELKVKLSKLFSNPEVYVEITHKDLESIEALGDADVSFARPLVKEEFSVESTMGSVVELTIEAKGLDLKAYQGGQVLIDGSAQELEAYVNTGGILSATDLICQSVDVRMNTGGKGELTVKEELEAAINTGSSFSYYGNPGQADVKTSLGGSVSAWDEDKKE